MNIIDMIILAILGAILVLSIGPSHLVMSVKMMFNSIFNKSKN